MCHSTLNWSEFFLYFCKKKNIPETIITTTKAKDEEKIENLFEFNIIGDNI